MSTDTVFTTLRGARWAQCATARFGSPLTRAALRLWFFAGHKRGRMREVLAGIVIASLHLWTLLHWNSLQALCVEL